MLLSKQGIALNIWMSIFTVIITVIVTLRFVAARIKKRSLRPDDWMILIAFISTLALEGTTWWSIANGLGAHTSELDRYELGVQYKILLGTGVAWLVATTFCKLSILWFYTCIFTTRKFKILARVLMVVVAAYCISFFCVFFTNCRPLTHAWNPVPGGHCKSVTVEEITSVSVNMAIDIAIVVLPMPSLWKLQMATKKKVGISVLFGLGLLVVAVMAWRLSITVHPITMNDFVYGLGNIGLVTHLEVWIGISVACIPTLAPVYSKYLAPMVLRFRSGSPEHTSQREIESPKDTVGSPKGRGFWTRNFSRLESDTALELEEGRVAGETEAVAYPTAAKEGESVFDHNCPKYIGVTHDIQVESRPWKGQPLG